MNNNVHLNGFDPEKTDIEEAIGQESSYVVGKEIEIQTNYTKIGRKQYLDTV